jgi:hypothetical protein
MEGDVARLYEGTTVETEIPLDKMTRADVVLDSWVEDELWGNLCGFVLRRGEDEIWISCKLEWKLDDIHSAWWAFMRQVERHGLRKAPDMVRYHREQLTRLEADRLKA